MAEKKIYIARIRKPVEHDINKNIKWIGQSFGLFNLRDKDSSCYRIFVEFLKSARSDKDVSSDELAYRTQLSRGTIVHHLNKLASSGIIISERNRYRLREGRLSILLEDIRKDINRTIDDMKEIADKIDKDFFHEK